MNPAEVIGASGRAFGVRVGVVSVETMRALLAFTGDADADPETSGVKIDHRFLNATLKIDGLPVPFSNYDLLVTQATFDRMVTVVPKVEG